MKYRAKPKFVLNTDFLEAFNPVQKNKKATNNNELFFNSGRNGLTFLLKFLKVKSVGLQSFNCIAVLDAIKKADCNPIYFDVKLSDFSISIEELYKNKKDPDVLILTHYQGIPNLDYLEIVEYCKSKKIILIEDIAQSHGSNINGLIVGSQGDYSICSFALDKPFTCFEGGSLQMKQKNDALLEQYSKLSSENNKKAKIDIKKVKFYHFFYTEKNYSKNLENKKELWEFLLHYFTIHSVFRIMKSKLLSAILYRLIKVFKYKSASEEILRLSKFKINLVRLQRGRFDFNKNNAFKIIQDFNITLHKDLLRKDLNIYWNRLSVLDKSGELSKKFRQNKVDCGNYNWPQPLHTINNVNKQFQQTNKFVNSELASNYILNIPCW